MSQRDGSSSSVFASAPEIRAFVASGQKLGSGVRSALSWVSVTLLIYTSFLGNAVYKIYIQTADVSRIISQCSLLLLKIRYIRARRNATFSEAHIYVRSRRKIILCVRVCV